MSMEASTSGTAAVAADQPQLENTFGKPKTLEITPVEDDNTIQDEFSQASRSLISFTSDLDHLVVMVHGMKGSEKEWMYVSEQLAKQFPEKVFIHCSKQNERKRTYDGVDVMGERLANEVIDVIERRPNMRKISFIAYSVGGLVARYAIGRLYNAPENEADSVGTIGGLLAMNFITLGNENIHR